MGGTMTAQVVTINKPQITPETPLVLGTMTAQVVTINNPQITLDTPLVLGTMTSQVVTINNLQITPETPLVQPLLMGRMLVVVQMVPVETLLISQSMIVARGEVQTALQKEAIMNAVMRAQKKIALVKIQKGTIVNGMEQKWLKRLTATVDTPLLGLVSYNGEDASLMQTIQPPKDISVNAGCLSSLHVMESQQNAMLKMLKMVLSV